MDLPPWSDDQAFQTSFAYEIGYDTEENLPDDFSFRYGRDMLEEDALNVKSCMQVLKIWIDKADEDIVKLEEDILMLQCQHLAWDDEEWSKQCSAALREKIDRLDILIESSKKDNTENGLQLETEELPPRLHDLLKPLLEGYLAKDKQTETHTSVIQRPAPAAVEPSNKRSEEKAGSIVLKTYERKSKSMELEEKRISLPQQEKDAVIRNFDASDDVCTNNKLFMSTPSTLEGRRMLDLVRIKLEPVDLINEETGSQVSGTIEGNFSKPQTEASSNVQKPRVYKHGISSSTLSSKPSVNIKGITTRIPQTPDAAKDDDRTQQLKRLRMEYEHQIQVQQKCKEWQQVFQRPSTENSIKQIHEVEIKKFASEVTAAQTALPRQAKQPPLSSQISKDKEGLKSPVAKLELVEYEASNSTAGEAMDGMLNTPQLPFPFNKNKDKLTITELRAIAKSRQLHGYSKLKKGDLKTLLGLD